MYTLPFPPHDELKSEKNQRFFNIFFNRAAMLKSLRSGKKKFQKVIDSNRAKTGTPHYSLHYFPLFKALCIHIYQYGFESSSEKKSFASKKAVSFFGQ